MQAYVINHFGGPEVFEPIDLAVPRLLPGHVLIKVVATSINPVDVKIRQGKLAAIAPEFPAILHGDVAGVIEQVGERVSGFKPGDEVYACAGGVRGSQGALADYILADADLVALKPMRVDLPEAAALPLVSITAWTALIDKANVQPGQLVLIHGATGGVSHIAIQLAKAVGATVYATCSSPAKAEIAKSLGADHAINYHDMDVTSYVNHYTQGKGFDVVFDTVGGENIQQSFKAAALNGKVVTVSARSNQDLSLMHSKGLSLHVVFMLIPLLHHVGRSHQGDILRNISRHVDESRIRPLIDVNRFRMSEIGRAHAQWESGNYIGKILVEK